MQTRRAILVGAAGLPFFGTAARAATSKNSRLLLCRLSLDKTVVRLDGTLKIGASLEAREEYVRIFAPLRWGEVRGFRLQLTAADGRTSEPHFHPPVSLPPFEAFRSVANYRALDVGEQTGFSSMVNAKDIFPSTGRFRLHASYVPEPLRAGAPVQAIVFENGPVDSATEVITVS